MKKLLLITLLAAFMGCKKDAANKVGLKGSWEYRGTACYCLAATDTNAKKPGNGNIIIFADNTYKRFAKDTLKKSGTYVFAKDTLGSQPVNRIIYDNDTASDKIFFRIDQNKLTFFGQTPLAADGPEYYYERIKS